jgi:D-tyrosyl-tRNA(Tyr) deacylase
MEVAQSMRAIIQRVRRGVVSVDGETTGAVDTGLVVLVGATHQDTEAEAQKLAHKTAHLRIFEDDAGKMNLSALDVGGGVLVVSQFTLYADCKKGRRPSFTEAAPPEVAEPLIEHFASALREAGVARVETGVFRAYMLVEIYNDGPVTIILDTDKL